MDTAYWVAAVMRWAHVLAAIAAVGGSLYWTLVLMPAAGRIDAAARDTLAGEVRARWSKILGIAILLLLASGIYNLMAILQRYDLQGTPYHMWFGIKFLLALVVFLLASMLAGRSESAVKLRAAGSRWAKVTLLLAVIVVCISGALRLLCDTLPMKNDPLLPRATAETPSPELAPDSADHLTGQ